MKLFCSTCHTAWTESVLTPGQKCPFLDCRGFLTNVVPKAHQPTKRPPKPKPGDLPILRLAEEPPR